MRNSAGLISSLWYRWNEGKILYFLSCYKKDIQQSSSENKEVYSIQAYQIPCPCFNHRQVTWRGKYNSKRIKSYKANKVLEGNLSYDKAQVMMRGQEKRCVIFHIGWKLKYWRIFWEKNMHAHLIFLRLLPKQNLLQHTVQLVGCSLAHRGWVHEEMQLCQSWEEYFLINIFPFSS